MRKYVKNISRKSKRTLVRLLGNHLENAIRWHSVLEQEENELMYCPPVDISTEEGLKELLIDITLVAPISNVGLSDDELIMLGIKVARTCY